MKGVFVPGILVLGIAVIAGFGAGCLQLAPESQAADQVTVAYSPYESTALLWIAQDRQFFGDHGINVTLRRYDSGAASLEGVLKGEADLSVGVTEFPVVRKVFQKAGIRILGTIDRGEYNYLVARRDRGIETPADLKGKRVGTALGTIAEFHLGRFLVLHGMNMKDITLVDAKTPEEWINATADGQVDAMVTSQPYADAAGERLGTNAVFWSVQSSQPLFALIVATDGWTGGHEDTIRRFLLAFADAEEYLAHNPGGARAIVQDRLGLEPAYMDTAWGQNEYALTLDQSLVLAMEDEARWMIANNLTNATSVPDFGQNIDTTGLETVKPGSVNIIG